MVNPEPMAVPRTSSAEPRVPRAQELSARPLEWEHGCRDRTGWDGTGWTVLPKHSRPLGGTSQHHGDPDYATSPRAGPLGPPGCAWGHLCPSAVGEAVISYTLLPGDSSAPPNRTLIIHVPAPFFSPS